MGAGEGGPGGTGGGGGSTWAGRGPRLNRCSTRGRGENTAARLPPSHTPAVRRRRKGGGGTPAPSRPADQARADGAVLGRRISPGRAAGEARGSGTRPGPPAPRYSAEPLHSGRSRSPPGRRDAGPCMVRRPSGRQPPHRRLSGFRLARVYARGTRGGKPGRASPPAAAARGHRRRRGSGRGTGGCGRCRVFRLSAWACVSRRQPANAWRWNCSP